jgi:hypothetical protein
MLRPERLLRHGILRDRDVCDVGLFVERLWLVDSL